MTTDDLITAVKQWGENRKLNDPKAQLNKVIEEVGEIAHEVSRNQYDDDFEDAIGDALVTIIILANIKRKDPVQCLRVAYDSIKDRTGSTKCGTFIKDAQNS